LTAAEGKNHNPIFFKRRFQKPRKLGYKFRAFDTRTGKLLWEVTLPSAGNATPTTYEVNGRQYVVIAAGGSKAAFGPPSGGVYVAFALAQ
jgi:quinoprotein glucose dehydrogenase